LNANRPVLSAAITSPSKKASSTPQRRRLKSYPSLDNFRLSLGQKDFCVRRWRSGQRPVSVRASIAIEGVVDAGRILGASRGPVCRFNLPETIDECHPLARVAPGVTLGATDHAADLA
jgi:hypothetical protein